LEISAADWATLSPLVDEALDLSPKARIAWLNESATVRALAAAQREQLHQLIKESDTPETDELLATLPQFALKAHQYVDSFKVNDVVGPYQLLEKVGVGGMSEVWRARRVDGAYEREVALKLPYAHASVASREHFIRRMERERDLLARLEHPNIARFYDAGIAKTELGAQPYLALEFVKGKPLIEYANAHCLTIDARCKLFLQVLDAVQYAHQRFVVHRDLKPSNILVRENGQVALLDFGIAKVLDEETQIGDATALTREMGRAITLAYASPEQLLSEPITTASDVYSAGVLFYELLCGKRPFAGHDQSMMSLLGVLDTPPPSPTSVIRNAQDIEPSRFGAPSKKSLTNTLSGDLAAIVAKSLRRDAAQRYASSSAFAEDLQRFLTDQPVHAREGARLYAIRKFVWRQRVPLAVGCVGALAAIAFGVTSLMQRIAARESAAQADSVERLLSGMLVGMSPETAEKRMFTASELLDRAVANLPANSLSQSNPAESAESLVKRLVQLYESIGAYDKAIALLEKRLAQLDPRQRIERAEATMLIAQIHMRRFDMDRASLRLAEIEPFFVSDNAMPTASRFLYHYLKGWEALNSGLIDLASKEFDRLDAILKREEDVESWLVLDYWASRASLEASRKNYADAQRYYELLIERSNRKDERSLTKALSARVGIAEIQFRAGNYSAATDTLPEIITALESRYGESYAESLRARYLLAGSRLFSGKYRDARATATKLMSASAESSVYRVLAKVILVESALHTEPLETIERELSEWSASDQYQDTTIITAPIRERYTTRWRAAKFLMEGKTESAQSTIQSLALKKAGGGVDLQMMYIEALIAWRLGQMERSRSLFDEILLERKKRFEPQHPGSLLVNVYYDHLFLGKNGIDDQAQKSLLLAYGENSQLQSLLKSLSNHGERGLQRNVPFVYISERS
jgi:eukaryotic-like serine/threonine-protein kinase